MFGRSNNRRTGGTFGTSRSTRSGHRSIFSRRVDPDRRAGGFKAALHNPNTTHEGRRHAKHELRAMGRGSEAHGHPSFMSRIKHALGIHSRNTRTARTGGRFSRRRY